MDKLTAAEALYGFAAWLTGRKEPVTFGAERDAAIAAELVDEFCKAHDLDEPRENYHHNLWPHRQEADTDEV